MRQLFHDVEYCTLDPTEGRVHKIVMDDGHIKFVLCFPKEWKEEGEVTMQLRDGPKKLSNYTVTQWEEIVIKVTKEG